jgi:di/tripeptidase
MKLKHKSILFFRRIAWYIEGVYKAISFYKQVKNFNFLIKTKEVLEMKLLEVKRNEKESETTIRLEAQIDVIQKILKYGDRR